MVKEVKSTVPWTNIINDFNDEKNIETFYEKELQKTNQQGFRIKKINKRKGNRVYVKWEGNDNSFSSLIDKKYLIE